MHAVSCFCNLNPQASSTKTLVLVCHDCKEQDAWWMVKHLNMQCMWCTSCFCELHPLRWLIMNLNMCTGGMDTAWILKQRVCPGQCQFPTFPALQLFYYPTMMNHQLPQRPNVTWCDCLPHIPVLKSVSTHSHAVFTTCACEARRFKKSQTATIAWSESELKPWDLETHWPKLKLERASENLNSHFVVSWLLFWTFVDYLFEP